MMRALALVLLSCSYAATAQPAHLSGTEDPRLQTIAWQPGQSVPLVAAPGNSVLVILSAGERIENIAIGDRRAFQIEVSSAADSMFITPLADNAATSMNVVTDARTYAFELQAAREVQATYVVRFTYPSEPLAPVSVSPPATSAGVWRVRGDRNIRPVGISDDGERTYLEWGPDQSLPAVFAIGPTGAEQVVDGYMRGEVFVIDRVHERLVFRIDRDRATASRSEPRR